MSSVKEIGDKTQMDFRQEFVFIQFDFPTSMISVRDKIALYLDIPFVRVQNLLFFPLVAHPLLRLTRQGNPLFVKEIHCFQRYPLVSEEKLSVESF